MYPDYDRLYLWFGAGSRAAEICLGVGWSQPEAHFTWAVGPRSTLILPPMHPAEGYQLRLYAHPFAMPGQTQALRIACNGIDLGDYEVHQDGPILVDIEPAQLPAGNPLQLEMLPRYAKSPRELGLGDDVRPLSFCLHNLRLVPYSDPDAIAPPIPGMSDRQLMMQFESLADDCELGFAQREVGAEPLGMLRWAGLSLPRLHDALANRFEGIDSRDETGVMVGAANEYLIDQRRYRYRYHTFVYSSQSPPEEILRRALIQLAFGKRRLLEDLAEGTKLFVVKSSYGTRMRLDQVRAISELIAGYGGGTTFWVRSADESHPPGSLRWHGDRLLEGQVDRLCEPGQAQDDYSPLWLPLCRAAYRAHQAMRPSAARLASAQSDRG